MPEGDTVHRAARRLHAALVGRRVLRFVFQHPGIEGTLEGGVVADVRARGKHLLIDLSDGRSLHSHLRMRGSWHVYAPGEPWRHPPTRMSVAILATTEGLSDGAPPTRTIAVGFDLATARIVRGDGALPALGPDLLEAAFDVDEAVRRLRSASACPLGVALMRQALVSGIGNVYKSELLFLERLDPFGPVGAHDEAALRALIERGRVLLARNLGPGPRVTRRGEGGRLWVYRRSGEPCFVCGELVRMRRQGEDGRSTYFCPSCQGVR